MRNLLPSRAKLHGIAVGFMALALLSGCQKSEFEISNGIVSDAKTTAIAGANGQNYIVISKTETLPAGFDSQISAFGEIISSSPEIGQVIVRPTTVNFEKKVSNLNNVRSVIPDLKMRWVDPVELFSQVSAESIGDNESFFELLWNMRAINAPAAWDAGFTGKRSESVHTRFRDRCRQSRSQSKP